MSILNNVFGQVYYGVARYLRIFLNSMVRLSLNEEIDSACNHGGCYYNILIIY